MYQPVRVGLRDRDMVDAEEVQLWVLEDVGLLLWVGVTVLEGLRLRERVLEGVGVRARETVGALEEGLTDHVDCERDAVPETDLE